MMKVEQANHCFVVQISDDEGNPRGNYLVDQFLPVGSGERGLTRVRNQMEQQLFHQFRKTGLHYAIIYEGNPEMARAILDQERNVKA